MILVAILLSTLVPKLDREIFKFGIALGLLTLFYFLVLRVRRTPSRFPAKEFIIGLCFAAGTFIAAHQFDFTVPTALCGAAMTGLFTANCLAISLAESEYDRASDPAAHFAQRTASKKLPLTLLVLSALSALSLLFQPELRTIAASAIVGAALSAIIVFRSSNNSAWVQPVADAVLLFPWVFLAFDTTGPGQ